jgi:hypothetical protein
MCSIVPEIDQALPRERLTDGCGDGEAADAGIEDADGPVVVPLKHAFTGSAELGLHQRQDVLALVVDSTKPVLVSKM